MKSGLLLPQPLIQPFELEYFQDDLHVMAYFDGHPEYEAVEAMIRLQPNAEPVVRVILTRHDTTQVDHVNDESLWRVAARTQRETVRRHIHVEVDLQSVLPSARLSFDSARGEAVAFEVVCATPPDPKRGGLSDPGDHSGKSSLPIMLRGKSALIGAATRVQISGIRYAVPERFRLGDHLVAHHGHYTVSHHMGIVRTGRQCWICEHRPETFSPGEQWAFESNGVIKTYRIDRVDHRSATNRLLSISRRDGPIEIVTGTLEGDQFRLDRVQRFGSPSSPDGLSLSFDAGRFAIGIDQQDAAITGVVSQAGAGRIRLVPQEPAWARKRPLQVDGEIRGPSISIETRICAADL